MATSSRAFKRDQRTLSERDVESFDDDYPQPSNINTNRDSQIQPLARSREVYGGVVNSGVKRSTIDNLASPAKRSMKQPFAYQQAAFGSPHNRLMADARLS